MQGGLYNDDKTPRGHDQGLLDRPAVQAPTLNFES